jgi:flagellar biosynthesis component FlhA
MKTIKELFSSAKFLAALAAVIVWLASYTALDISLPMVAAALAVVCGWLGVTATYTERRVQEQRERAENFAALADERRRAHEEAAAHFMARDANLLAEIKQLRERLSDAAARFLTEPRG